MIKNRYFVVLFFILSACSNLKVTDDHAVDLKNLSLAPKELSSYHVNDPEPPGVVDQELESIPPEMQAKVDLWINYFQGRGRPHMERYLERSTRYIQLMKRILRQNGLPEDLVYVALIESGFSSRATSRAAAVGYWQFIKGTGRRYGLQINSFVDERRDPVLSTQAAAEYFKGLYSVFGSWYLSMASYNVGENRVKKEVMNHFTRDFWELARKRRFPKETANYIPKFIAARLIGRNPEKYGFSDLDYEKPLEFELIKVDKPINLKTLSAKMNLDYEELKRLNPKFRGEIAPLRENSLELRVPVGQVSVALQAAQESYADKVVFIADAGETETYRVKAGDSLYSISKKFRTTVAWLRDVNDIKPGRKLRIGMRLQVPDKGSRKSFKQVAKRESKNNTTKNAVVAQNKESAKAEEDSEKASKTEVVTSKGVYYIVQPGDNLSMIAEEYDTTVHKLQKLNRLGKGSMIKVGSRLKVPKDEELPKEIPDTKLAEKSQDQDESTPTQSSADVKSSDQVSHKVQAGENLTLIAKKYGVTVQEILEANNLKNKSKLNIGKTLIIPVKATVPSTYLESSSHLKTKGIKNKRSVAVRQKIKKNERKKIHVVKRGENLSHIASKYQVSLNDLKEKNKIDTKEVLFVGAKLIIPNSISKSE